MSKSNSFPSAVQGLIDRFAEHRDAYLASGGGGYNETQLRREFLDPLFGLQGLGWDIDNTAGYAEAYKDVIHEDAIKVGGATKAPDYCFRIGGVRKFFLEAKKPSVDIKGDPGPAYQLRRYAWSAKLPLSILSDFEEFAVYDCRIKPAKGDKPSVGRVMYFTFDQLDERWDGFASIFSQQAILKGAFDKYAESTKRKRGTAEVDTAFLEEIEQWRDSLARNLALRNDDLNQRDLNFAVQRTIDRIIFLRICEDRGVEQYGTLQSLVNGDHVYDRLFERFRRADERYNSGLFHFDKEKGRPESPDDLTPGLTVDDKTLKDILARLYYPDSPYEFSVLPADILGQVYEQFLGKVIRLTKGHRAVVEEKPEVRKAGGVYYTPTYIVDYIVKHTVGKLVEDKTPQQVAGLTDKWQPSKKRSPITVLDPACGSGSFLLGAYQFLLDWYRDQYIADSPKKHATGKQPRLYHHHTGDYRLTTAERKRILTSHIYGVDIDSQAVETTKLSLLLKVLEGENAETLGTNLRLFHERALPDLVQNIKCGNSLIGPDFYDNQQIDMFDEEERLRINVFDWKIEFKTIMDGGGFDAVIGNPPYVRMEEFKPLKDYLSSNYHVHADRVDLYAYFIEREHHLLRNDGRFGMIVSNKFLRARYGRNTRQVISELAAVDRIVDLSGLPVFRNATVRTIILLTTRSAEQNTALYSPPPSSDIFTKVHTGTIALTNAVAPSIIVVPGSGFDTDSWILRSAETASFLARLRADTDLLCDWLDVPICYGVKSGLVEAFVIPPDIAESLKLDGANTEDVVRPYLLGRQICAYVEAKTEKWLIYTYHGIDLNGSDAILEHLAPFRKRLSKRATKQEWYELQQPQRKYVAHMARPKIVFPDIANQCRFGVDYQGRICADTAFAIPVIHHGLLALLNSRFAWWYFREHCAALEGPNDVYLRFKLQYVQNFPVPDGLVKNDRGELSDKCVTMLDLHKQLATAKTGHAKTAIQRQIDATDQQIDQLIYELYGLTDEEIAIVEEVTSGTI